MFMAQVEPEAGKGSTKHDPDMPELHKLVSNPRPGSVVSGVVSW